MPIYDYECQSPECGLEAEVEMPISSNGKKKLECPQCGAKTFKRMISKVNFVIKGASARNGYYIPPTNEQLGYKSERDMIKEMESAEDFTDFIKHGKRTGADKEEYEERKRLEKEQTANAHKYFNHLKEKHRFLYDKMSGSLKKAHNKRKDEIAAGIGADVVQERVFKRMKLADEFEKQHPEQMKKQRIKIEETVETKGKKP